jgi:hypothetical protein
MDASMRPVDTCADDGFAIANAITATADAAISLAIPHLIIHPPRQSDFARRVGIEQRSTPNAHYAGTEGR